MAGCEICAVLSQGKAHLLETDYWFVTLTKDQGYLGRSFVTLREHKGDLASLSAEQWLDLQAVIQRYERAVRQAFGAELFNWGCLMNNAFKAEQPEPHVHWHVRPRYRQPVRVAGEEFIDPNFGHHYDRSHQRPADDAMRLQIEQRLKEYL